MQTVLLAGGYGSRLSEETVRIPKPMVEVAGRPIMLHVMDIYSHWGQQDFIVADGHNGTPLWHFHLGQVPHASPMSYGINGKQYFAIAAGSDLFVFGL